MKCSKECIIFSWVNVILMKAISFMVCISLWKNSSVCIFYHSALLKWLSPETGFQDEWRSEFACMKVMVFVERNWPLRLWAPRKHRDPKLYIFQHKGYEAILSTRLSEKYSFTAFFFCFLLAMSLDHLSLGAGTRGILTNFFMSDVRALQWKSLSGTQVGKSYILHYANMDDYSKSPFEDLRNLWLKALSYNHI